MRPLRVLLDFLTYEGTPPTNNPIDETRSHRRVEEQNVTQTLRAQPQIAPATSNVTIPLANSTNDYLAIFCDQPVTLNLNSDSTAISLIPQLAGKMSPVFFMRGVITSVVISNPGAIAANLDVRSVKV